MPSFSAYNHFYPWRDGYYLAYNARSGAVALMTRENYEMYQTLGRKLSNGASPELSSEEFKLFTQLQFGQFACPEGLDELEWLRFQHFKARYDESSLGLIIAPTLACNMACEYCYEENKKGRMPVPVVEAVLAFIETRAPRLKQLEICWYGGEPLLALNIVEDLTASIQDLKTEHGFEYGSSVITNGTLLTPETLDKLQQLKVNQIQVTLDGPAAMHDKKRPLKNGGSSFSTIIQNLQLAKGRFWIGVRVNIDKSYSVDMIDELLTQLDQAGLREHIGVYFGLLEPASSACANIAENCYDAASFSQIEIAYYQLLLERGFQVQKLPTPMSTFCMAQQVNSFLLDPDGDIYRCYNYVGDKTKSMGLISEPINYQHAQFSRLFKFDPFQEKECQSCEVLPICMGGCPAHRTDRAVTTSEMCESWKYNLEPMLDIIARSRQAQAKRATKEAV